jgi:hypothetical protein
MVSIPEAGDVTVVGGLVATVAGEVTTVDGLVTIGDILITVEETNSPMQVRPCEFNLVTMASLNPAPKESVYPATM